MNTRSLLPYAWMLGGCFSFAWMSEFASQLGRMDCDWRIVALARSLLAFLFAIGLARMVGADLVLWKPPVLWMRSIAGSISLLCTFYAFTHLKSSEVLTLTNTFPIWVALLSWPLLRVRPNLAVWIAAGCGVLGVVFINYPRLGGTSLGVNLAVPLALFAAFTSAVAMLGLHRLKDIHPWAIVAHFSGVATLFVGAACLLLGPMPWQQLLNPAIVFLLLGVGVSATVGQMCLTMAFTTGEPAKVSIVGLSQIVFAICLDLIFDITPFQPVTLAGIALVMAPTAWMMADRTTE